MGDDEINYVHAQRLRDFGYHLVGNEGQAIAGYMPVSWTAAVAAERERCAKVAESSIDGGMDPHNEWDCGYTQACVDIAAKIRSGE